MHAVSSAKPDYIRVCESAPPCVVGSLFPVWLPPAVSSTWRDVRFCCKRLTDFSFDERCKSDAAELFTHQLLYNRDCSSISDHERAIVNRRDWYPLMI
jgi:hypothetical protein